MREMWEGTWGFPRGPMDNSQSPLLPLNGKPLAISAALTSLGCFTVWMVSWLLLGNILHFCLLWFSG